MLKICVEKNISIAVASSGIAITLLLGEKTAHSTFKIKIEADRMENAECSTSRNSHEANLEV